MDSIFKYSIFDSMLDRFTVFIQTNEVGPQNIVSAAPNRLDILSIFLQCIASHLQKLCLWGKGRFMVFLYFSKSSA